MNSDELAPRFYGKRFCLEARYINMNYHRDEGSYSQRECQTLE